MQTQLIDKTIPSIQPLHDTWDLRTDAGAWVINLSVDLTSYSSKEINIWYKQIFVNTIEAFSELIRVREVVIISPKQEIKSVVLKWQIGNSYEKYIQKILNSIKEFPLKIISIEVQVDFCVFVRTIESPDKAIRGWVQNIGKFSFCNQTFTERPYLYLDMDHTLFCPSDVYGGDNTELYYLNQPLLETALRSWEQKIGKINEVDGIEGIYEYGFLPDEDD